MADLHYSVNLAHQDWSWRLGDGALRLHKHGPIQGAYWWTGDFCDPRGMCSVYRQADHTRIDFVFDGRCHSRSWRKYWSDRTIARLARALISDVLGAYA